MKSDNKKELEYIKLILFKELNKYLFVVPNAYKHVEKNSLFLNDYDYTHSLYELVDDISTNNKYPKNVIVNIEKLLKYYLFMDYVKPEAKELYSKLLDKIKGINKFSYEFLDDDYNLKYSNLDINNQISGEKYDNLMRSLLEDYRVMIKLTQNDFDEKIDDKNTVLAIKKFMIIYPELFKIKDVRSRTYDVLENIYNKFDDGYIKQESLKLVKHLNYNDSSYFDMDSFINYYETSLIIGLATNSNFLSKFKNMQEEDIMNYRFVSNLLDVIKNYGFVMNSRVINNLFEIVDYVNHHFEKYYGKDTNHVINKMKIGLNKHVGSDNMEFLEKELTYRFMTTDYDNLKFNSRKEISYEYFMELKNSIMNDQYNYSEVLKSYFVDDETFYRDYFDGLVKYSNYAVCITKIDYEYPALLLQEKVNGRTKKVLEAKLNGVVEGKKDIKAHEKVLKMVNNYHDDI